MIDKNMVLNWAKECADTAKFMGSPIGTIDTFALFYEDLNKGNFDIKHEKCKWSINPKIIRNNLRRINTSCNNNFLGNMRIARFKFCPYCSKEIEEIESD